MAQYGITLDVGEIPEGEEMPVDDTDPARAIKLTAHAIARIADRLPFTRKLNRHLEGQEARAGLASDVVAIGAELGRRNPEAVTQTLSGFAEDLNTRRQAQAAKRKASPNQPPQGG